MTKKSTFKSWIQKLEAADHKKNRKIRNAERIAKYWRKAPESSWFTVIVAVLTLTVASFIG